MSAQNLNIPLGSMIHSYPNSNSKPNSNPNSDLNPDTLGTLAKEMGVMQAQDRLSGTNGQKKDADKVGDKQTEQDLYTVYKDKVGSNGTPSATSAFVKQEAQLTGMSEQDIAQIIASLNLGNAADGSGIGQGHSNTQSQQSSWSSPLGDKYTTSYKPTGDDLKRLIDPNGDIPVPPGMKGVSWQHQDVDLYPSGQPAISDVNQGGIGDCLTQTGLSDLATQYPDIIKNAITDNKDGTYDVKMFDPTGKPITMKVNSDFLTNKDGSIADVHGANGKADWASIMEKAMVKYDSVYHLSNGGTGDIGGWGAPQTLPMFLGKSLTNDSPSDMTTMSDDDIVNMINTMLSKGEMPGCGLKGDSLQIGDSKIIGGHSYAVIGVAQQDGHAYVELRNPWGSDAGNLGSNHDGITFVPIDQFKSDFNYGANGISGVKAPDENSNVNSTLQAASDLLGNIPASEEYKAMASDAANAWKAAATGDSEAYLDAIIQLMRDFKSSPSDDPRIKQLQGLLFQAQSEIEAGGKLTITLPGM